MSLLAGLKMLREKDGEAEPAATPADPPAPVRTPRARGTKPRSAPAPASAPGTPPAAPAPAPVLPAPVLPPEKLLRESLGVRVRAPYKAALDQFVYSLKAEGWPVQHHHILELLLEQLRSEEGRAEVKALLAESLNRT